MHDNKMPFASENGANVRFYLEEVEDKAKTREQRRPVFKTVELVEIIRPGDQKTRFVGFANLKGSVQDPETGKVLTYIERYPGAYQVFKSGETSTHHMGTPVAHLPGIARARVHELKAAHIHTIEQLSEVSIAADHRLGPDIRDLQEAARQYLDEHKTTAEVQAMREEMERMRAELAAIKGSDDATATATEPPAGVEPAYDDNFDDYTPEQLRNIITNWGGKWGPRSSRETLLATVRDLNAKRLTPTNPE